MRRNIKSLQGNAIDLQSVSEPRVLRNSSSCLVVVQKSFKIFSCLNLWKIDKICILNLFESQNSSWFKIHELELI